MTQVGQVRVGQAPIGRVLAVRIGKARTQTWGSRTFVTGAAKEPVDGPVLLTRLGFTGDEQGNLAVHGGPDKAAMLYPVEHYAQWRTAGVEIPEGGFFENLTISGVTEADVHLGDTWRLGAAVVQVTQPRRPCRTLSDRWGRRQLPRQVQASGRSGFYVRVLTEGLVAAGDDLTLQHRPPASVSALEAARVMDLDRDDVAGIHALLAAPELPASWREKLRHRLAGEFEDDSARLGREAGS